MTNPCKGVLNYARGAGPAHRTFAQEGVHMETGVFNNTRGSRFFCCTPKGVMIEVNTREDMGSDWHRLF